MYVLISIIVITIIIFLKMFRFTGKKIFFYSSWRHSKNQARFRAYTIEVVPSNFKTSSPTICFSGFSVLLLPFQRVKLSSSAGKEWTVTILLKDRL
jgi:hypothetical protein